MHDQASGTSIMVAVPTRTGAAVLGPQLLWAGARGGPNAGPRHQIMGLW
jgi:hypothetical protein